MSYSPLRRFLGVSVTIIVAFIALESPDVASASKYAHPSKSSKSPKSPKSDDRPQPKQEKRESSFADSEEIRYPHPVTDAIRKAFKAADVEYRKENWPIAEQAFSTFVGSTPYTALKDAALYRLADIASVRSKESESRSYLTQLIAQSPDPEWRERARFLLGRSLYMSAHYQNAHVTLTSVLPNFLQDWQKVHYYSLLIRLEEKRQTPAAIYPYYFLRLLDTYDGLSKSVPGEKLSWMVQKQAAADFVNQWVFTEDAGALPSEISDYVGGPAELYALLHTGQRYFKENNNAAAYRYLHRTMTLYPDNPYAERVQQMLAQIGNTNEKYGRDGYRVGVMLPLSGPYRKFGYEMLRGLRCGNGDEPRCGQSTSIAWVVRDTEGEPQAVERIFKELANSDAIQAIIGPMSTRGVALVAEKAADDDDLAVITLSPRPHPNPPGNVFHLGIAADAQIRRLVEHSRSQGISRVGILYPETSYGREMATLFEHEFSTRGGQVVAKHSYGSDTDVADSVRALKLNVSSFSDAPNAFDAIFIPDSQAQVRKIGDTLLTHNVSGIPLIGTNAWNGDPFPRAFEMLFPDSFFTDVFSPASTFSERFRAAYAHDPNTLEALGYDLAGLVNSVLERGGSKSRSDFTQALDSLDHYKGVTGLQGFTTRRDTTSTVYILTQKDGAWVAD